MWNGRLLQSPPTQQRSWWLWWFYARFALDLVLVSALLFGYFVIVPALQQTARELRKEREADVARQVQLEDVRKHQVLLEAELLVTQERNIALAKQLQKMLERNP